MGEQSGHARARQRFGRWSPLVLVLLLATAAQPEARCESPPSLEDSRLVVVLYPGANDGSPGAALADQGFRQTFDQSAARVDVQNEFLDLSRFADPTQQTELAEFLRRKYSGRKVDVVVAGLSSATKFALAHRADIFPGAPLVFMAVDRHEIELLAPPPDVVGHPIEFELKASLDVALGLHPATKQVIVIVGRSEFDRYWEAAAREAFQPLSPHVELQYWSGQTLAAMRTEVERLPPRTLVYYLHVFEDGNGQVFMPADVLSQLAARSNAPIYSHVDSYIGRGIVGGRVFSFKTAGEEAARLTSRILAGENPAQIGIQRSSRNSTMFDWRELRRWGISAAQLPPDSELQFREPTLWDQYKWHVVGIVGICGLQALLIGGLLIQRSRRAKAETHLRENREVLRRLAAQMLGAQESERRLIARELHDDLGQDLALLAVELDLYRQRAAPPSADAAGRLETMSARVKNLSSAVHDLSHQLHPMKLEQLGLEAAIRSFCQDLNRSHALEIEFESAPLPHKPSAESAICLYRIAQEALRNVVKHSGASRAIVRLFASEGVLRLVVSDNGRGFDAAEVAGRGGLGLVSMRERLRLLEGNLTITSNPDSGTILDAGVPWASTLPMGSGPHGESAAPAHEAASRKFDKGGRLAVKRVADSGAG